MTSEDCDVARSLHDGQQAATSTPRSPGGGMASDFERTVKQFISEHISSVAQLEVLLLLRSTRDRQWTARDVGAALYTEPEMVAEQLAELDRRGLLAASADVEPCYRYRPATGELDDQVSRLDAAYKERRVAVITAIYSQPLDKVRIFADAFKLRKDK